MKFIYCRYDKGRRIMEGIVTLPRHPKYNTAYMALQHFVKQEDLSETVLEWTTSKCRVCVLRVIHDGYTVDYLQSLTFLQRIRYIFV
jgi:hypothetical protein